MSKLPSKLYSRAERWLLLNKWLILAAMLFSLFFVLPFFNTDAHLDDALLEGIEK